jgi:hypothetical protein
MGGFVYNGGAAQVATPGGYGSTTSAIFPGLVRVIRALLGVAIMFNRFQQRLAFLGFTSTPITSAQYDMLVALTL